MAKTLLLADDSVTIQKVVGISFASEDIELVTVDNGDDALARAREAAPDLILADVVMPGLNGYELCEAVKKDEALAHVPVLLLTGTFEAFDEERANRAGASGHVAKPFEAQTLVEQVNRLLAEGPNTSLGNSATATVELPPVPEPSAEPSANVAIEPAESDDAFDFFDDDLGDIAAPVAETVVDPVPAPAAPEPDAAFAFNDEFAPATPDPVTSAPPPEATVAILPDEEPLELATPVEPIPLPESPAAPEAAPPAVEDDFDFAFEEGNAAAVAQTPPPLPDDDSLRVGNDDLAQATVLDPAGASGYDVSSSDLGDPLAAEMGASRDGATVAMEPESAPVSIDPVPAEATMLLEPEPSVGTATDTELISPMPMGPPTMPPFAEPMAEPVATPIHVAEEPLTAEPIEMAPFAEPITEPMADEPLATFEEPPAASATAQAAIAAMGPRLREQIHDTVEKAAWEAFGGATEAIVTQAVERIEQIAWEVVPQLAEQLIREEIRRLKGDDGDA